MAKRVRGYDPPKPLTKPPIPIGKSQHLDAPKPLETYRGALTTRGKRMKISLANVKRSKDAEPTE